MWACLNGRVGQAIGLSEKPGDCVRNSPTLGASAENADTDREQTPTDASLFVAHAERAWNSSRSHSNE